MKAFAALAVVLFLSYGCTVRNLALQMDSANALSDASVISDRLHQQTYARIMVVPPSGTAGPAFDKGLTHAERGLMNLGVELISPAVTGRVIGKGDSIGTTGDAGVALSDLERALALADQSNADGVLQIGEFSRSTTQLAVDRDPGEGTTEERYFVLRQDEISETTTSEYNGTHPTRRWRFQAPSVQFTGKLIDVQDGTILAAFSMTGSLVRALPRPYLAHLQRFGSYYVMEPNWQWLDEQWLDEAEARVLGEIFAQVGHVLAHRQDGSPER